MLGVVLRRHPMDDRKLRLRTTVSLVVVEESTRDKHTGVETHGRWQKLARGR